MGKRTRTDDLRKKAEQRHRHKGLGEAASLYAEATAAFAAEGKHGDAAAMLQSALAGDKHRNDGAASHQQRELRRLLAHAFVAAGHSSDAIAEYEEYLKMGTPDAPSLREVAELYIGAAKTTLALDRLRRAIDRSIAEGDISGAAVAAGRIVDLMPDSLEAQVQYVTLLRNVGDDRLLPALERLALLYRAAEKLSAEVSACREILELAPARADVKARLTSLFTRILEMDPHDDDAWRGLRGVDPDCAEQLAVLLMDELAEERARSKAG
jgi:tetratricopeptide (TPR) repeat protein